MTSRFAALLALSLPLFAAPAQAQVLDCAQMPGTLKTACEASVAACQDMIQDRVPWNRQGSTNYLPGNLAFICFGAVDPGTRVSCYNDYVQNGYAWDNAARICRGTTKGMSVHSAGFGPPAHNTETSGQVRSVQEDMICTTRSASIGDSFEKNFILREAAQSSSIAPGMVFHVRDLDQGDVTGLGGPGQDRKTLPIFVSFFDSPNVATDELLKPGADRGLSRRVDGDTLLTNVNTALRELVGANASVRVLGSNYQVEEVHSNLHLSLALEGAFSNATTKLKGSFDFDKKSESSRIVAQFLNTYYGVHVDYTALGKGLDAWFEPSAIPAIKREIDNRGALVFVDSVIYGRAAYFLAQTESEETKMKNTLDAAYSRGSTKISGKEKGEMDELVKSSRMRAIFMGDFGRSGRTPGDIDAFREILEAERSSSDLGVPIGYTLRFVENHRQAATHVMTTIKDRTCRPLKSRVAFNLDHIEVILSDDEGTDNQTEIRGSARLHVEYDDPATGKVIKLDPIGAPTSGKIAGIELEIPLNNVILAENLPGREAGANAISDVEVNQRYVFEIPDAPETPLVNEVKTARFVIQWGEIIEDDSDNFTNSDDIMEGKSPSDTFRRFSLNAYESMSERDRTFHFRGDPANDYEDAEFKLVFTVDTLD